MEYGVRAPILAVKKDLFGEENPVGQQIAINDQQFKVLGVVRAGLGPSTRVPGTNGAHRRKTTRR